MVQYRNGCQDGENKKKKTEILFVSYEPKKKIPFFRYVFRRETHELLPAQVHVV